MKTSYKTFKPFFDILPCSQQMVWPKLKAASELGFVLYGGTAIALRLGHRISIDFDFFTEKNIEKQKLLEYFPFITECTILQEELNTLSLLTPSNVKLSFFGGINFGRFSNPEFTEDHTLLVASLDDLMATKLKVILQRIEAKDYKDIAAMLKNGLKLERGLALAKKMYGNNFQPSESLKAMVYFKGGDLDTLTHDEKKILIDFASRVTELPQLTIAQQTLS
ncbi:MAG: nucleotidyl transferase AbiEii/AbiGii toxin family protein [Pseudomonadota bacterium]